VMQDVNYELFAESVKAECTFGIKNPDADFVAETMATLELIPFSERHPGTLSGGQKQRLAVAVGQVCKKELIVFDEPTSGLDYESMEKVAKIV
ncbi:ATP-binding cassette domain-containing protein, partial [Salmonella enterica]|uniref:ATP-binding cassette domain-containing protein n=1 Tax=Salmonella enterica TaxID=28901 RepID=UPI0015C77915